MMNKFIWDARKPKIRYEQLCLPYEEAGLKLANLEHRDSSLKVDLVRKVIETDDAMLKQLAQYLIGIDMDFETIWKLNLEITDVKSGQNKIDLLGRHVQNVESNKLSHP